MAPPRPPPKDYGTLPTTQQHDQEAPHLDAPAGVVLKRRPVPGWAYLVLFVLLYSANNAVLAKFMARGPPFTICGIMCVGNALGCASLYPVFYKQITVKNIRKVTGAQWGWMLLGCLLSNVLGSVAYLEGLKLTSVPARAMTGRLESVDFLLASAVFLGDTHGRWVSLNALLTVVGVVTAILYPLIVQHHDPHGKIGYIYLVIGGWGYTLSLIITKRYLVHIPVGLLSLFKLALGTILFHALSTLQQPGGGSMGLYSWELWRSMLWYAPLFVTSTMVLWLRALKLCSPALLSVGMNFNYLVTVLMGILIVGKWPTPGETIGGGFILLSIVSGLVETYVHGADEDERALRRAARKARKAAGASADKAGWPIAQPAAPAASPVELEKGELVATESSESGEDGDEEEEEVEEDLEDETARLIHKHKHQVNNLDFDSLCEGDGVGIHPFN